MNSAMTHDSKWIALAEVNEWTNEWMNEIKNERMNECTGQGTEVLEVCRRPRVVLLLPHIRILTSYFSLEYYCMF